MLVMWAFVAIIRTLMLFLPTPPPSILIPEPVNTVAFVIAAPILLLIEIGVSRLHRSTHQQAIKTTTSLRELQSISPNEFEELVAETYRTFGHKVRRVGQQGDHGVDLVIGAKNGEKWVAQCKRWQGSVGEPIIRDFYGAMQHEGAAQGAIITTGTFTPQARQWAKGKPIQLHDGEAFMIALQRARANMNER